MVWRLRSVASRGLTLAVVMALSGAAAADYHGSGEPPPAEAEEAEASEAVATEPADTEPRSALDEFIEFVKAGRVEIFLRPRWENAKQDAQKTSNAMTLRTALGYGTKPWHGFSVFAEFENIASPNNGLYYDGIGTNGSNRTQISDPTETELNQAYGDFALTTLGSYDLSAVKASVRGGRQRIVLDDARFVGNVIWRQNEQTYDAVKGLTSLAVDDLTALYAYVWESRRIFGNNGATNAGTRNYGGDSHFVNVRFDRFSFAKVTAFAYLLDFNNSPRSGGPENSSNTYGFRLVGSLPVGKLPLAEELELVYAGSYARQTDTGKNQVDYDADYGAVDVALASSRFGSIGGGYEVLGSDNKKARLVTPLATGHKFNGFADVWLDNGGVFGLRDAYGYIAPKLPWDIKGQVTFHQFWSDQGTKRGFELNGVFSRKVFKYFTLLHKVAWYQGQNKSSNTVGGGRPDRYRVWLEVTFALSI